MVLLLQVCGAGSVRGAGAAGAELHPGVRRPGGRRQAGHGPAVQHAALPRQAAQYQIPS